MTRAAKILFKKEWSSVYRLAHEPCMQDKF